MHNSSNDQLNPLLGKDQEEAYMASAYPNLYAALTQPSLAEPGIKQVRIRLKELEPEEYRDLFGNAYPTSHKRNRTTSHCEPDARGRFHTRRLKIDPRGYFSGCLD